ncbi:outer membrane lipoprotein carrier protein LolA [Ottowia thiooxydans]|uniref:outer membrane lipoprotein carrier protein LolA n=1 Tax=Ottowia thiooxydans TaxID=219182 RepID=UPI0003FFD77E|nr:outer membrane lipoprotein carrier protein LolA [Ottowia thiooxydans]
MIFGTKTRAELRFRKLLILAALAWSTATPVWANWNLDELMKQLAQHPAGSARFVETKKLSVLDAPVVSSGTLFFSPPDRLEKNTLLPKPESMVLERDRLTLSRDGRKREVRLQQYPEVMSIVEAIRSTLMGNQSVLRQYYALQLQGSETNWRLILTPAEERTQRWITQIMISGKRNQISTIETLQADGDRSVMAIEADK